MLIDINSDQGKRQSNEFLDRQLVVLEDSVQGSIKSKLNAMFLVAAKLVEMGDTHFDFAINKMVPELQQRLLIGYKRVYRVIGDLIFAEIEGSKSFLNYQRKTVRGIFDLVMEEWSENTALNKATTIAAGTQRAVTKVLIQGIAEGLSYYQIAKKIRKVGKISTLWKAKRIVRTEAHTVAMKSLDEAIKITKSAREKEWITAGDERVRRRHDKASGERVFIDDFFTATGEALMYPGDERGSADNIINCRCNVMYHT